MCFCKICVIVVIFSCELFSWERLSWSLYCDSFVASHITNHGEWWFKLRPRCFVNSQLLWYYRRWRICSSIWRLFVKTYFPILEIPQIQCRRVERCGVQDRVRFARKHRPELCECLGIPEKITCVQRTVCGGMEGLCILLKRLAYPCSYTARPQENQRVMYNGHKRIHSIKFQSVVIPNGLIANLHGPFEGKRHDSTML